MLEGLQFDPPHNVFHGVRFFLAGFDPINKSQVYSKLVDCGGVNVDQYGLHCTHVIVDKLTYDDPLCVAARKDGKILVNGLWVAHSFDVGVPVDPTSIIYRPPRDLNGIPGAKPLLVCLTGYQRQDRDDIMTMVSLMGANFSKPLVANKLLILYATNLKNNGFKRKETACGNQKLGGPAASHNETCHQEKDGARQLEATSGKRKLDESSPMQIAAKAYTRSSGKRLSSKTKKTEASEAHRGNEFLNAVGEGNGREVELGLIENYEEDKYKEAPWFIDS